MGKFDENMAGLRSRNELPPFGDAGLGGFHAVRGWSSTAVVVVVAVLAVPAIATGVCSWLLRQGSFARSTEMGKFRIRFVFLAVSACLLLTASVQSQTIIRGPSSGSGGFPKTQMTGWARKDRGGVSPALSRSPRPQPVPVRVDLHLRQQSLGGDAASAAFQFQNRCKSPKET